VQLIRFIFILVGEMAGADEDFGSEVGQIQSRE
jgi:hypothetical protein